MGSDGKALDNVATSDRRMALMHKAAGHRFAVGYKRWQKCSLIKNQTLRRNHYCLFQISLEYFCGAVRT